MFWIIIISFAVLIALAIVIYMLPSDPVVKAKKKKEKEKKPVLSSDPGTVDSSKDWKSIAERWEKHNQSLQGEIEKMKMDQKRAQQLADEKKSEAKDLVDKLALEKSWREKEQETLEKFKHHEKDLKDQIYRTEGDLEKEHSNRLRLERELQEIRIKYEQILEEKRQLSIKASSQQSTLESNSKELRELKSENAQLKEKREDIQWVTKSEFDELKKAFAIKEKELAQLKKRRCPDMNNLPFAHRTNWHQESNAFNKALEELGKRGIDILDLTASNPTACGFLYPEGMLSALNSSENLKYQPDACGLSGAREAVSQYYARQKIFLSPRDIILTASTSEAYSFLMRLLVNPGEKILIPRPSYPLFQFLLEINDVNFDYYPLQYDGGRWCLDSRALEHLVDAKTRAIILVNPNNPTGSFISRAELNSLNEICHKHQMSIISDEVFFEYPLYPGDAVSCAGNQTVLTFALGGLSKTLGLPQMKCAWILASGPQGLLQESLARLEIIADTYLSVNTPVQNALGVWLDHFEEIQGQIKTRVQENGQWLSTHLNEHVQLLSPQGGWYATLRIPAIKSEEEWVLEFLREDHVSVYPGYFFDFEREAYIVLSLICPMAEFREGVGRIMQRLAKI